VKVTEIAVHHPLIVVAFTISFAIFGILAYTNMPIAVVPNINFPSVTVSTPYPGADPQTVEAAVTTPIENALAAVQNIDTNGLTSTSMQGVSIVQVQFNTAADPNTIVVDVERVVNAARNQLPANPNIVPSIVKQDPNASSVVSVAFTGSQPLALMQDFAENVLQKQFNNLPGVSSTTIQSGLAREVHVLVNEGALRGRGLAVTDVVTALQTGQFQTPAGTIWQGTRSYNVYFDALAHQVQDLRNLVIRQQPTGPVYLRDVATVEDTYQQRQAIVRVNGREGLAIGIAKTAQASTIDVVNQVKATMVSLQPQLPPGTQLDVVVDRSVYTQQSFDTVQRALVEAVLATGLILLLFLHTWRSTVIVLVSIPTSVLTGFAVMSLLGYNLNLMTMLALTLAVGILVDDSIVVLENIARHLGMGKNPIQAAIDGRSEIGLAAMTITMVDVVVYVPIAVMVSSATGQFIRPFAVVIAITTLVSLLVSFTLTPLLASRFLQREEGTGNGPLAHLGRYWDRGFTWLEQRYEALLRAALPHRWIVIAVGVASFVVGIGIWRMGFIGFNLLPSGDQSEIDVTVLMPPDFSLDATNDVALAMERTLRGYPEVTTLYSAVGAQGGTSTTSSNQAQITVRLVPPEDRARSAQAIGDELRQVFLRTIPGARVQIGLPNPFGFGGFGAQPIQVQVQGVDPTALNDVAAQVQQVVRGVPGAASVQNSNDNVQTQIRATIDWTRAADLGVTPQTAANALQFAVNGFQNPNTQFVRPGLTSIDIRVLNANAISTTPQQIRDLPVSTSAGSLVSLNQLTTIEEVAIPTVIKHVNRLRSVTIGAEPGPGGLVGDLQNATVAAVSQVPLPPGYQVTYGGQGYQGAQAFGDVFKALAVALLLMYMLMMMLFNSVTLPLAVMMSLPLALVGAFGAMALTRTPFTLFSLLGFAVLLGLVGKNAILLVDYTEILEQRGYSRTDALLEAGPTRLRPILMTTLSVMSALLPIASGLEQGSELLRAAAVVLIGGLLTSTLLTLVFVPAMFTVFDDVQRLFDRLLRRGPAHESPSPADGAGPAA
jgi:hydrophobic/amphiphilic exporter-1 (mainly G- bacteria), HAE1 family